MKTTKVMGSATAPAAVRMSDRFGSTAARLEREAIAAFGQAIRASGGSNAELKVSAKLRNLLEGTVSVSASWFDGKKRVVAAAELAVAGGALPQSPDAKAVLATAVEQTHASPTAAQKTYRVDPALLRARRVGAVVALSHDALPEWGLQVPVEDIKAGREAVEERISNSAQGFCASMLGRNADFMTGLKLPVVASDAPAEEQAPQESTATAAHPKLEEETAVEAASAPGSKETSPKIDPVAGSSRQWEAETAVRGTLYRTASDAAVAFVRKSLSGGSPSVTEVDLSGVVIGGSRIDGSAVVAVSYYGARSREQATIEVPFDARGKVVSAGVGRTKADVAAAEEVLSKMEIASREQAKAIFDKFVADQAAEVAQAGALSVNATSEYGYGSNWVKRGPAMRIPIAKHVLPEEFSQVGKKILLGGLVYELQPTDYNAPSIARSVHWMLELRSDIPASKADYAFGFGGLGEALATSGL